MLEVSHINKLYGKKEILHDISFVAKPGECIAIVGRNGCGKSTLLQIIAGIIPMDDGTITVFGKSASSSRVRTQYLGYVPQDNPLMEELSVIDNLRLWQGKDKTLLQKVMDQFELIAIQKQKVSTLSGGMKRRLSIACALLKMPPIMILDEPTTALDLYYKDGINKWMESYLKGNGIIVMTTHEESEIACATRCLLMDNGMLKEIEKSQVKQAIISGRES